MLDAKAYQAHFPDDPAYDFSSIPGAPGPLKSAALMDALAALVQYPAPRGRDRVDRRSFSKLGRASARLVPTIAGGGVVIQGWNGHPRSDAHQSGRGGTICA